MPTISEGQSTVTRADEAAAISLTAMANIFANRFPARVSVPANLATATFLTWFARRIGATWSDMGWDQRRLSNGIRWGITAAVPVAMAVALGIAIPPTRRLFVDEHTAEGPADAAYRVMVRIPLMTALPEEALFRGALLGVFERRHPRWLADSLSGVLFGLWHILPTIERLAQGGSHDHLSQVRGDRWMAVLGVTVATMAAGSGFAWLRDRSGSLAAPVIAHAALNGLAFLGAYAAARMRPTPKRQEERTLRPWPSA
jgi:membrane protease YdiL (CAAX protease family)